MESVYVLVLKTEVKPGCPERRELFDTNAYEDKNEAGKIVDEFNRLAVRARQMKVFSDTALEIIELKLVKNDLPF